MAKYVVADKIKYRHGVTVGDNLGDLRAIALKCAIDGMPPADVVEREKIDEAIKEMELYGDGFDDIGKHNLGSAVENCIEILKRNIGE